MDNNYTNYEGVLEVPVYIGKEFVFDPTDFCQKDYRANFELFLLFN